MMDNDLVLALAPIVAPFVCCFMFAWFALCLSQMKNWSTESTENITIRDTRRNAVIQLPDVIISPEPSNEETHADSTNSSRIARQGNYHQSLSVCLPPEIIHTPSQQVMNPECDSPPNYESLYPK